MDLLKTASVSEQEAAEKQSDLALKSATVEAARANVRRLEELQSFARVTAPFAGTITARETDVGQLITAGSAKELFRLAKLPPCGCMCVCRKWPLEASKRARWRR